MGTILDEAPCQSQARDYWMHTLYELEAPVSSDNDEARCYMGSMRN